MRRITQAVDNATTNCALAQFRAILAPTPELRTEHERIAMAWRDLAASYQEAERVSGFIEWAAQRMPPP